VATENCNASDVLSRLPSRQDNSLSFASHLVVEPSTSLYRSAQQYMSRGEYLRAIDFARSSLRLSRNNSERINAVNLLSNLYYYVKAPEACIAVIESFPDPLPSPYSTVLNDRLQRAISLRDFIKNCLSLYSKNNSGGFSLCPPVSGSIAILGDSHVAAFARLAESDKIYISQVSPPLRGSCERLSKAIEECAHYDHVVLSFCGNLHTIFSLSLDYSSLVPCSTIPFGEAEMADHFIRGICYYAFDLKDAINSRKTLGKPTYLAAPPPPKSVYSTKYLAERAVNDERLAKTQINENEQDYLLCWQVACNCLASCAKSLDIGYIPHPDGCQDQNGFLLDVYHRDLTHANSSYANLFLDSFFAVTN